MNHDHIPVCRDRVLELLTPAVAGVADPVVVDATVGLGGHARAILQRFPTVRLVGLDRDPDALRISGQRLAEFGDRASLQHCRFDAMGDVLAGLGLSGLSGVLFDFGVSSMQIDDDARGFAYSRPAPLDMRMDPTSELTAAEVVNTYPVGELSRVLWQYGQERHARRIARAIVAHRPLETSSDLVAAVERGMPAMGRRSGHPAKRTFQAIRIEVNSELESLAAALPVALQHLLVGGRFIALSYHSLEDKMVKEVLGRAARPSVPEGLPVVPPDSRPWVRLITRGSEVASSVEVADNPRARSVRLRAAEKVREAA